MAGKTTGKLFLRAFILALMSFMLMVCTAYAVEVDTMRELLSAAESGEDDIVLTGDIEVTQTINLYNSRMTIGIDLNGHQLTRGNELGTMFNVSNGGGLTIWDSKAVSVQESVLTATPERDPKSGSGRDTSDGTGIALPSRLRNGELTYYLSRSTVNADGISTTETRYEAKADVGSMGGVLSGNRSTSPMIRVSGSNSTLNIQGGAFSNPYGRVIEASGGAVLNLTGGYFYNSTAGNGSGGAVYVTGWDRRTTVNIGGVQGREIVFAGNSAANGGALAAEGGADLNIHQGAVFTGNTSTGWGRNGGGALFIGQNVDATMDGGLITNNWGVADVVGASSSSSYEAGGGGVMVRGTLLMTDGQITHNEAAGGGGISTFFWDGGVLTIRGGIIAGNVARINEGGGITVNLNGSATIVGTAEKATYITNNATETEHHWGGGGLFAADYSTVRMLSVVITDNEAGGFGGGLAGCSTGRIDTHALNIEDHSVALYGNKAAGTNLSGDASTKSEDRVYAANDPVFMREGDYYQDYFCALNTTVCGGMLGGGTAMWTGTVDGRPITPADIGPNERITSQYITGLTGDPSDADIAKGIAKGRVFVTGNSSGTHGGGILCNGYLIVGTQKTLEIGDRMTIKGDKTVSGGTVGSQFVFIVEDDKGNQVTTGSSQGDSEITFHGRIPFDEPGTYTYWIYEADDNIPEGVKKDPTRYRMVVTVETAYQSTRVPSATDPTQMEDIEVRFNKISSVQVYKCADENDKTGTRIANYTNISSENRNAYELPTVFEFVNRVSKDTGIVVSKTVHDLSGQSGDASFRFTVTLDDKTINGKKGDMTFRNGVATFTLKGGESLRAVELPVNVRYTVTESPAEGYYVANSSRTGTTVQDVVQSVVFENIAVGSLEISKTVENGTTFDVDRIFAFTITLNNNNINGPFGSVIFEKGIAHVEIRHGQKLTIPNLPAGVTYQVMEESIEGFTQNKIIQSGTIAVGETSKADFVNTRKTGELHIKKYVIDSDYDGEKFDFLIQLVDAAHINGKYGDATFYNGRAVIQLGHGETAKITGLPTGLGYTVDEVFSDEYSGHYAVGVVGDSAGTIKETPAIVEYTNEKFAGLEIRKDVSGTRSDLAKAFSFELILTNDTEKLADQYGELTFRNGKATFTLKDGEYLVLTGLPDGTKYTVRELDVDGDIYNVQINDVPVTDGDYSISGILSSGDSAAADFHNFRRAGELEISKTITSPVERDKERVFAFTVTVSEPITVRLGDLQFVNGVAHVFLTHNQTVKASPMPAGLTYTIVETPIADFDSSVTKGSAKGTIEANETSSVTFNNARRLGGLKIRKVVEDHDASPTDVFGFKIVLDRALNGTFGQVTFAEGVGTFELKNGETVLISNLPEHTVYTIIETSFDALKYQPVTGTIQGDIDYNSTVEVDFHNDVLGTLIVSKRVEGVGADENAEFGFTVTLSDKNITGVYGDMAFDKGVATFTLKHGEYKTASKLPADISYQVTEAPDSRYRMTVPANAAGMIDAYGNHHVSFVNTFITGDLTVKKAIAGDAANADDAFDFTVTLTDKSISGVYGDMTFTGGVAAFSLKGGETRTAKDLPAGVGYTVTEADSGYTVTAPANASGTIAADSETTVEFINSLYITTGGLTVEKIVTGTPEYQNHTFTFTVTLDNANINGKYGEMEFVNGVATFSLSGGQTRTASDLPEGTGYTVTEGENELYSIVSAENVKGVILRKETAHVTYTNTLKRGGLTVSKSIAGDGADLAEKFTFTVTLSDASISGTYGDMTFANGVASFELGHQESASATGLPAGIGYTVTEVSGDYTATSTGATGTIAAETKAEAAFVNTKMLKRGGLTVSKSIAGDGADLAEKFTFTVTLSDASISGVYGDMTFANGVASFELGHQESASATGLPAGIGYTVTEVSGDYTATSTGATGTIAAEMTAEAAFVNTKNQAPSYGSLMVKKTIAGNAANVNDAFTFTVTLSDASINGTYGSMTFQNGVATFTLKGGEMKTAEKLPAGIGYIVEEAASDYTMTSTGATGTIAAETKAEAAFVNTKNQAPSYGSLMVKKTIAGNAANVNDAFTFTVTLSDASINGTYGSMTFQNGVATFTLKGGEMKTAEKLPAGIGYIVEEAASDYTMTSTGATGTINADSTAEASFVNTKSFIVTYGDLTVSKQITGSGANLADRFTFVVTLSDTGVNGVHGDMTFVNGVATFQLGHGEHVTARYLPDGVSYRVEEVDGENYEVSSFGASGVISSDRTAFASFTNHYNEIKVPATGDHSLLGFYLLLMVTSVGLLMVLRRKMRKA